MQHESIRSPSPASRQAGSETRRFTDRGRDARCELCRVLWPDSEPDEPRACGCAFELSGGYCAVRIAAPACGIQLGRAPDDCTRCGGGFWLDTGTQCAGCGAVGT